MNECAALQKQLLQLEADIRHVRAGERIKDAEIAHFCSSAVAWYVEAAQQVFSRLPLHDAMLKAAAKFAPGTPSMALPRDIVVQAGLLLQVLSLEDQDCVCQEFEDFKVRMEELELPTDATDLWVKVSEERTPAGVQKVSDFVPVDVCSACSSTQQCGCGTRIQQPKTGENEAEKPSQSGVLAILYRYALQCETISYRKWLLGSTDRSYQQCPDYTLGTMA